MKRFHLQSALSQPCIAEWKAGSDVAATTSALREFHILIADESSVGGHQFCCVGHAASVGAPLLRVWLVRIILTEVMDIDQAMQHFVQYACFVCLSSQMQLFQLNPGYYLIGTEVGLTSPMILRAVLRCTISREVFTKVITDR